MSSLTDSRSRSDVEQRYGQNSLPTRVANRIRTSWLLKFAILGIGILAAGLLMYYGNGMDVWGPVLGATGIIIVIVNLLFYLGFLAIKRKF